MNGIVLVTAASSFSGRASEIAVVPGSRHLLHTRPPHQRMGGSAAL
jgi:hypothetical protein